MEAEPKHWVLKEFRDAKSPMIQVFRKREGLDIATVAAIYPYVCYLTFHYQAGDESGLPSSLDHQRMHDVELNDIPLLEHDELSVLVAVALGGGVKDFIFYTRDPNEFLARASRFRSAYPDIDIGCEVGPDPDGSHYRELP